ncbi:hypothetical protein [Rhodococcus qingshengii]|uniref:hypothetical protein n=1 Tax=Rhodococcus qingshengii TaxID=334542 RepID=UPI00058724BD|nr:hypothetical protein [Rhodococcus qingshengii]
MVTPAMSALRIVATICAGTACKSPNNSIGVVLQAFFAAIEERRLERATGGAAAKRGQRPPRSNEACAKVELEANDLLIMLRWINENAAFEVLVAQLQRKKYTTGGGGFGVD